MDLSRPGWRRSLGRVIGAVPSLITRARRNPPPEDVTLVALMVGSVLLFVLGLTVSVPFFPPVTQSLPVLAGGVLLRRRAMYRLLLIAGAAVVWDVIVLGVWKTRPGGLFVLAITALVGLEFSRSREETGLGGLRGDTVLVGLRQRLEVQGELPRLVDPWRAETVLRAAGDAPFAGDFIVSACREEGQLLDVALVDVSGKGVEAGTRSLLLSGALGGLLGALPPAEFLPAANDYLVSQEWEEGFATACHFHLDLRTGAFSIASAGHPPAAHFDAGSGRWSLLETAGPALGLLPHITYDGDSGVMRPGDALLLYTDGLVEVPGRDLAVGIDKLLGVAERLLTAGFDGGGELLVQGASPDSSDDRGLVLLWRVP